MGCRCWVSGDNEASGAVYTEALVEAAVFCRPASLVVEEEQASDSPAGCFFVAAAAAGPFFKDLARRRSLFTVHFWSQVSVVVAAAARAA